MRALLILLALAISSTAVAQPSRNNGNCTTCHTTNDGVIEVDPAVIDARKGDTIDIGFTLTHDANSAIALFNLENPGLDAIIQTPDNWTFKDGTGATGADPVIEHYISDEFVPIPNDPSSLYNLRFTVGPDAILDTYIIQVVYAGKGDMFDTNSFTVNVIPIPAAVWLFGSGLLGLVGVARMRRNKT